jgi:glycosyltransferase involved in cell wall biosynthesis
MRRLRVAVNAADFWEWGGGIDLIRILVNSLVLKSKKCSLDVLILFPIRTIYPNYKGYLQKLMNRLCYYRYSLNYDFLSPSVLSMIDALKNIDGQYQPVFCSRNHMDSILKRLHVDVVFPVYPSLYSKQYSIPQIGYLFDFQHEYYPHFFTPNEIIQRRAIVQYMLSNFKAIFVNAREVKKDVDKFFPIHNCRIFNLPFAASPIKYWLEDFDFQSLHLQYKLPSKYFMIANQFWIHKSHITAFRALAYYSDKDMHMVCTGKMQDYRDADYFSFLKKEIHSLGIDERVHFLGYVPKLDQIRIMRSAYAVLQPTLFEGAPGGGAVYDAVALGIPTVISDIPVNLEIDSESVIYFKAGSSDDMVLKMEQLSSVKRTQHPKEALIQAGQRRSEQLVDALFEAILYVTALNR